MQIRLDQFLLRHAASGFSVGKKNKLKKAKQNKKPQKDRKRVTPGQTDIPGPGRVRSYPEVPCTTVC